MGLVTDKTQPNPSYWIPECFGEDLFAVLGDKRPDDKWLIVGPARSGSTYHKDPNATSAVSEHLFIPCALGSYIHDLSLETQAR